MKSNTVVSFLQHLAGEPDPLDGWPHYLNIAGFKGDPHDTKRSAWSGHGYKPDDGRDSYWGSFLSPEKNLYVCVSSFSTDQARPHQFIKRRKENFHALHAVMIDDIGTKVADNLIVLPPTALVETSPKNYQAWYFLDTPVTDIDRADWLIKRMVAEGLAAESDPGMLGVSRYGRLPLGRNGKKKYPGDFQVNLVSADYSLRYSVEQIEAAYHLSPVPQSDHKVRPELPAGTVAAMPEAVYALDVLDFYGLILGGNRKGAEWIQLTCPWAASHSGGDGEGAAYAIPSKANGFCGGFQCHHGHCIDKTISDLHKWVHKKLSELKKENEL